MLKETPQGPSESSGSNYHHKGHLIYQASNHLILTTLIVILFTDKILTRWFPLCFLRFVFATYGYFSIRADCPGNSPERQMSDCLLFAFVTVVCRTCFAVRVYSGSYTRSKAGNTYCADCNSSRSAQYFNVVHMTLKTCIRQVFFD